MAALAQRHELSSADHHLRHLRLNGGRMEDVLALVAPDVTAPFDTERPPWSLTIVSGLDGGAAAFVLRFHHAIADGVGALRLAGTLQRRSGPRGHGDRAGRHREGCGAPAHEPTRASARPRHLRDGSTAKRRAPAGRSALADLALADQPSPI